VCDGSAGNFCFTHAISCKNRIGPFMTKHDDRSTSASKGRRNLVFDEHGCHAKLLLSLNDDLTSLFPFPPCDKQMPLLPSP
jgi:hypothetical protein